MFKKVLRWVLKTIVGFVCILLVYALFAFMLPHIKVNRDFTETPNGIPIYVCSNGVHTDVVLPVNTQYIDWRKQFDVTTFKSVDSTFQYISFGWGNKRFYLNTPTWGDLTFSTAIHALFLQDSAAMHVAYEKYPPGESADMCHKIAISPAQYQKLVAYVQATLNLHNGQVAIFPNRSYDTNDNFYEATGHYSFLKTCNVWTCGALRSAGVEQALWSPFQGGVMNGYSK